MISHGKHVKRHPRTSMIILVILTVIAAVMLFLSTVNNANATTNSPGNIALNWAEANATGHWYVWGGTGPGYDCSGLVYKAFLAEGILLPRTTYGMLGSWHLVRTYTPQRGDLAFYGSGHVEFVTVWYHTTFGAHEPGTRVGWIGYNPVWGWAPDMFFRVIR